MVKPERQVVLVDQDNREVGTADLIRAHLGSGLLHRAVSVVVYRIGKSGPELLLQQRGLKKLLWPGVWSNTVCTHPFPGEALSACAVRRLKQEMGIAIAEDLLRFMFFLKYQAQYTDGLSERELDAVYLAKWNGIPVPDKEEIQNYRWVPYSRVVRDIRTDPDNYTPWFRLLMGRDKFREAISGGQI